MSWGPTIFMLEYPYLLVLLGQHKDCDALSTLVHRLIACTFTSQGMTWIEGGWNES